MRVSKRWNQKQKPRTIGQISSAVAGTIWKLGSQSLLNLETEKFETTSQKQRLDVLEEIFAYLIHQCDRRAYELTDADNRAAYITSLAKDMARLIEDSRVDMEGVGNYQQAFLDRLNQRMAAYSLFKFSDDEGASFVMRCAFGDFIKEAMGARDNKWIPDYIIGREAPLAENALKSTLAGLVDFEMLAS
jgi:hypothetical protein